jgi:hypothetical protein
MVKNHKLARSIIDSGWGYFKAMLLEYKAKLVFEVNSYHTSVDCSRCGNKVAKSLAVRTHHCDKCGIVLERDHNAALNILQRGKALLGIVLPMGHGEFTPVEIQALSQGSRNKPTDLFVGSSRCRARACCTCGICVSDSYCRFQGCHVYVYRLEQILRIHSRLSTLSCA